MTRLPVPDKFTDDHGNHWRLLAGPYECQRELAALQSAMALLDAGRIKSYTLLHGSGFYLYRDARGFVEWQDLRATIRASIRACALVLMACVALVGCGRTAEPTGSRWTAAVAGDKEKASVRAVGNNVTMEVRTYPKQPGVYAVARTDASGVVVETLGDSARSSVFVTRDALWEVRKYVGERPIESRLTSSGPVWVVVETGAAKATVLQ